MDPVVSREARASWEPAAWDRRSFTGEASLTSATSARIKTNTDATIARGSPAMRAFVPGARSSIRSAERYQRSLKPSVNRPRRTAIRSVNRFHGTERRSAARSLRVRSSGIELEADRLENSIRHSKPATANLWNSSSASARPTVASQVSRARPSTSLRLSRSRFRLHRRAMHVSCDRLEPAVVGHTRLGGSSPTRGRYPPWSIPPP